MKGWERKWTDFMSNAKYVDTLHPMAMLQSSMCISQTIFYCTQIDAHIQKSEDSLDPIYNNIFSRHHHHQLHQVCICTVHISFDNNIRAATSSSIFRSYVNLKKNNERFTQLTVQCNVQCE